ncbi:MAG TPA: T9SS type A sorting domain-containing protein [Flavipsychrobacter sp.]|nr:T9SS type A sorting domain-containing protein [Flavipsychrobacter sp.]
MKKFSIIILLALLAPVVSSAQYLNQLYDFDTSADWGYSVHIASDGNYMIFGGASKNKLAFNAKKIAPSGNELLSKTILRVYNTNVFRGNPGAVRQLPGGGYIAPLTYSRPYGSSFIQHTRLAKLDANGDTLWVRLHTNSFTVSREFMNDCNLMPDGGFITASIRGWNGNGILKRTDSNGNVLWEAVHAANGFYTCEYIGNGKILVGANKTRRVHVGNHSYDASQPWFLVYDTLGNLLKDTLYSTRYGGGGKIYKDKNGGFFHLGFLDSLVYPNDPSDIHNLPEYVAHLDDQFRIVWLKHFVTLKADKRWIWNVKQLKDDNYLIVGLRADTLFKPEPVGQGWAMKLDKNGFVVWDNHYYKDPATSFNYLVDAAERSNGSIVMTGTVGSTSQHTQDVWVVVVDSMGCVIPNCAPTGVPKVSSSKTPELVLYPNPTKGSFTAECKERGILVIASLQGQQIAAYNIKEGKNKVAFPKNSSGLYIATFKTNGGEVAKTRVVYQP